MIGQKARRGKARPVVIIQNDELTDFDSVVVCLLTSHESTDIPTRVKVEPAKDNGLEKASWVMTDKIASVSRSLLGKRIGVLGQDTLAQVTKQLAVVLGL